VPVEGYQPPLPAPEWLEEWDPDREPEWFDELAA
jgi:hypothetical protein